MASPAATVWSGIAENTGQTHLRGMIKDIPSPKSPEDAADRSLECQAALEIAFQELMARAVNAGWNEAEACSAIIELADHRALAMIENDFIAEQIAALFKKG